MHHYRTEFPFTTESKKAGRHSPGAILIALTAAYNAKGHFQSPWYFFRPILNCFHQMKLQNTGLLVHYPHQFEVYIPSGECEETALEVKVVDTNAITTRIRISTMGELTDSELIKEGDERFQKYLNGTHLLLRPTDENVYVRDLSAYYSPIFKRISPPEDNVQVMINEHGVIITISKEGIRHDS